MLNQYSASFHGKNTSDHRNPKGFKLCSTYDSAFSTLRTALSTIQRRITLVCAQRCSELWPTFYIKAGDCALC